MESTSVLNPASPQGQQILSLFYYVLVICALIFSVVASLVTYAAIRYRDPGGRREPKPSRESMKLEITWTVIPALIVAVLFVLAVRVMNAVNPPPADRPPDLIITAHQWWWQLDYPELHVHAANEIHLPIQRKQLLRLESADVVHDFWVPALGKKVDAIPLHPNYLWMEISRAGTYLGTCDEFCGAEHAWMRIRVVAETEDVFDAWVAHQSAPAVAPSHPVAERGARIFQERTCASCHTVAGTPAHGTVAPDLTHVASRETLASGVLTNNPGNLVKWIRNPQAVKPECKMPNLKLSESEVNALAAYMEALK
jgi:cytochrome c oxidase subunit 2